MLNGVVGSADIKCCHSVPPDRALVIVCITGNFKEATEKYPIDDKVSNLLCSKPRMRYWPFTSYTGHGVGGYCLLSSMGPGILFMICFWGETLVGQASKNLIVFDGTYSTQDINRSRALNAGTQLYVKPRDLNISIPSTSFPLVVCGHESLRQSR